ncbi:MAG: 4Fe-4S dicluster domain-containing protein [Anaerolineaceae bacterium]
MKVKEVTINSHAVPKAKGYIGMVDPKISACQDCKVCELYCALVHEGACGAELNRIWEVSETFSGDYFVRTCKQCISPSCMAACPVGAIQVDEATGARFVNEDLCTGCKLCIKACPFDPAPINFNSVKKKAVMCDLCKDRLEGPICVQLCPTMCLELKKY